MGAHPASEAASRHRVVVVGGGFGGMRVVRGLRRAAVDVTLVDRQNFSLFQPLVYQVATGALSSAEVAPPLRWVFRRQPNARVVLAEATGFDLDAHRVMLGRLANGASAEAIPYDTLVVAGGSEYSYFGHPEWEAHAPQLKSLEGALDIRTRVLGAFEAAEVEEDPERRAAWLTFVVVGGGPTGVEMAGQIAELGRDTLKRDFRSADTRAARVLLVEAADRVLGGFPESLSASAERALAKLGVTPLVGHTVVDVTAGDVAIRGAGGAVERVPARTAVWAAGVTAAPIAATLAAAAGVEADRAGRIPVGADLTVAGHPDVLALGDMAVVHDRTGNALPLPGVAPVAIQEGKYAAKLIAARAAGRTRPDFRYRDKGNMATIGRSKAVADIKGVHASGFPAWSLWLGVHLAYLIGFQNRLVVLVRWSISFFTHGRGARRIAGWTPGDRAAERDRHAA
ncbi:MAG TPA: NAD(P)/FAD-dependent oxidoreductase [Gaiellales bacterium]|nr:NAD(P)/FAD-dependent oxidoreductase [Gaiellales bacterium]